MKKLFSVLMAFVLLMGFALAEDGSNEPVVPEAGWFELDFNDFTMSVPQDIMGAIENESQNNVPFFMFYQDYDPAASFNKNLNGVWSEEVLDISSIDPAAYANMVMAMTVMQYGAMGIAATEPTLYAAMLDEHDGKQALSHDNYG